MLTMCVLTMYALCKYCEFKCFVLCFVLAVQRVYTVCMLCAVCVLRAVCMSCVYYVLYVCCVCCIYAVHRMKLTRIPGPAG